MVALVDALGRNVQLDVPPRRVVSLVPSETETVVALVGEGRLVGRTAYCEEPRGRIEHVPTVGGTKDVDVAAVLALRPDLVLANQEENSRRDVEALIAAGVTVHVSFPCAVREALSLLVATARMLGRDPASVSEVGALEAAIGRAEQRSSAHVPSVFVPIWKDPWMSFDGRTYASDLLRLAGGRNVLADRARRYPLAADLGLAEARPTERDTRYPRFALDEVFARAPERVLLPDEPYAFGETEKTELEAPGRRVELVSGKDLFWYGVRAAGALERLAARLRA